MLPAKRSAGITPEVSLREHVTCMPLASANKAAHSGLWNPEDTSPEVQNKGISGPTKGTYVLQKVEENYQ